MLTEIYGNSAYSLLNNAPSWTSASEAAVESGGDLMTINTLDEYYFGQNYLWGNENLASNQYHFVGFNKDNLYDAYGWSSGESTDWDNDPTVLIHRQNWDTQQSQLIYWDYGIMSPADDGFSYEEYGNSFGRIVMVDDTASFYRGRGDEIYAVYEYELDMVVDFPLFVQQGTEFTVDINLTAGTTGSELTQGTTIWYTYEINGVDGNGEPDVYSVTGSGQIDANGQFDDGDGVPGLQVAIEKDWVFDDDLFRLTFYSDDPSGTGSELGFTDPAAYRDAIQIDVDQAEGVEIIDGVVVADILSIPDRITGIATSDASQIIVSGDLINPVVESVESITTGKGKKNRVTTTTFTEVTIDQEAPLDALVVNGGEGNNNISGQGFADDPNTDTIEFRSAFTGVLVIDGKGGADTIIGGASGTNWLIGGGTADGTVDTLTGVSLATDIFDLRKQDDATGENWSDAYSAGGHAEIRNYNSGDFIVLSGGVDEYQVINTTSVTETAKGKSGKTKSESTTIFEIKKIDNGDLVAQIYGSDFDASSQSNDLNLIYGQSTGSLFDVVLNETTGQTILG